jgi:hypothetical protein
MTETLAGEPQGLRDEAHVALDEFFDRFFGGAAATRPAPQPGPGANPVQLVDLGDHGSFIHRWPLDIMEDYTESRLYSLTGHGKTLQVVVGRTRRDSWGVDKRKRAVVFGLSGTGARYPWTEFVEGDDGRYSAAIPNPTEPARPKAQLKDGDAIPDRFKGVTIERTDSLFSGVRNGPSLRLVVDPDEEVEMVRHGYWVAGLRKKL